MSDRRCCGFSKLGLVLGAVFLLAMVMGVGPGLLLVNPGADDPQPATLWGMPIIYAWALIWYAVQVVVVVTAYFTVWRRDSE